MSERSDENNRASSARRCPQCERVLPLTAEHWHRCRSNPAGYMPGGVRAAGTPTVAHGINPWEQFTGEKAERIAAEGEHAAQGGS